jgi:hypothetical protein
MQRDISILSIPFREHILHVHENSGGCAANSQLTSPSSSVREILRVFIPFVVPQHPPSPGCRIIIPAENPLRLHSFLLFANKMNPQSLQSDRYEELFTLLDLGPQIPNLVIPISTISIY